MGSSGGGGRATPATLRRRTATRRRRLGRPANPCGFPASRRRRRRLRRRRRRKRPTSVATPARPAAATDRWDARTSPKRVPSSSNSWKKNEFFYGMEKTNEQRFAYLAERRTFRVVGDAEFRRHRHTMTLKRESQTDHNEFLHRQLPLSSSILDYN